jgi:putative transposase
MDKMSTKITKARCGVYNVNYHLVWCSKRRKSVLVEGIANDAKEIFNEKASEMGIKIEILEVMPDHVHLFVSANPSLSPHQIVKRLKGATSNILRKKYPQLSRIPALWSSSYYVGTIGMVSESVVRNYIENQKGK